MREALVSSGQGIGANEINFAKMVFANRPLVLYILTIGSSAAYVREQEGFPDLHRSILLHVLCFFEVIFYLTDDNYPFTNAVLTS